MPDDDAARGEDEALKARMEKLSEALNATKRTPEGRLADRAAQDASGEKMGNALSVGLRALSEFIAGIIAGGVVGWLLDQLFGTSPAALIVFIFLGTAAGFWSIYRIAAKPAGR